MRLGVVVLFLGLAGGWLSGQEVRRALPVGVPAPAAERELAFFLAGVPVPDSSPLAALQKTEFYLRHVEELARLTRRYDENYFSRMRAWSAAELAPRLVMTRPVIYFFGGPDAVSALALFPDAPVYLLGGLEPVGSLAAPLTLSPAELDEALANLRKSLEVVLSYGHFITKDMKEELDRTAFRGVLPVIYAFVAMAGGEVLSASYLGVRADGTVEDYGAAYSGGTEVRPGVKVVFRRGADVPAQTVYYVAANVADDGLRAHGGVVKWARTFGEGNVYLKAASYLLHEPYFGRIRDFLLGQAAVLQDDSGIPFRYFLDGNWRCWFFGTYSGTLEIFQKYHQSDLQKAFAAPGMVQPLPFGTGYKWRLGESNLLLAVRQAVPRAEPVGMTGP